MSKAQLFSICFLFALLYQVAENRAQAQCGFNSHGDYICGGGQKSQRTDNHRPPPPRQSYQQGGNYNTSGGPVFLPSGAPRGFGTPVAVTEQTCQFYRRSFGKGDSMDDGPNGTRNGVSFYIPEPSPPNRFLELEMVTGVGSKLPRLTVYDSQGNIVFDRTSVDVQNRRFIFTEDGTPPPLEYFEGSATEDYAKRILYDKDGEWRGAWTVLKTNELYTFDPSAQGDGGKYSNPEWFRAWAVCRETGSSADRAFCG